MTYPTWYHVNMDTETETVEELSEIDKLLVAAVNSNVVDVDEEEQGEDPADVNLSVEARKARWLARRPTIAHLKDGICYVPGSSERLPLFDVGVRIVVDISTDHLKDVPWLQTIVGKVRSIDDDTGIVSVFDEDSDVRCPTVRWTSFKDDLHVFKLAPIKGNPFDPALVRKAPKPPLKPGEVRRGRGRPKGVKNRPKEIIQAEREARKEAKK